MSKWANCLNCGRRYVAGRTHLCKPDAAAPQPIEQEPASGCGTVCVECGPNMPVDDGGCCAVCGSSAVGAWADRILAALSRTAAPVSPSGERGERAERVIDEQLDKLMQRFGVACYAMPITADVSSAVMDLPEAETLGEFIASIRAPIGVTPQHECAELIGYIVEVKHGKEWRRQKIRAGILWDADEAEHEAAAWRDDAYTVRVRPVYAGAPKTGKHEIRSEQ